METSSRLTVAQKRSEQSRERRLELYNQALELHKQGMTDRAIGRTLHIGRKTVRRFLRAGQFPERARPGRPAPRVNKFRDYLHQRWQEGCHNATTLWHEIQTQGYVGGRSMVAILVSTFRTPGAKYHRQSNSPSASISKRKLMSPRQAAMLLARNPEKLDEEEKQLIRHLEKVCPTAGLLRELVKSFADVLRQKETLALQPWLDRANDLGLPASKSFCDGLIRDRAAVTSAISLKWSNGQVEGQVHRLKLIKRQMYGRASFNLLRARVLPFIPAACQIVERSP